MRLVHVVYDACETDRTQINILLGLIQLEYSYSDTYTRGTFMNQVSILGFSKLLCQKKRSNFYKAISSYGSNEDVVLNQTNLHQNNIEHQFVQFYQ